MKILFTSIVFCLAFSTNAHTQGTSCSSPITIALDAVLRNYPTSAATGNNVLCTSNDTTPVTWFKFTTNATAECPLLNITVSDSSACEVVFYTSCSSMLSSSSMCFYSGYGMWAPNENFLTAANTTYYLRVKTATACIIKIAGQSYTPPNGNCFGAKSLSGSLTSDNNSCNHADASVTPSQLCALTLENTAWYQFYVATTGYSIITISNIHCDNGAANNNNGFQMGFFTGTCSSLNWLNCNSGSGSTVQATTDLLPAGTKVFMAVDGISGANCSYSISGLNVIGVLTGNLKNFSGWKTTKSNILQWTAFSDLNCSYTIERSEDGSTFRSIGQVVSKTKEQQNATYHFEDINPPFTAFYRLKQSDIEGRSSWSEIIKIERNNIEGIDVSINNPVSQTLQVKFITDAPGNYVYSILNIHGQKLLTGNRKFQKGMNSFSIPVSSFSLGQYCLVISNEKQQVNRLFIKN